jgi:hypothetical protein
LCFDLIDALRHELEPEVATSGITMVATMVTDAFDNGNGADPEQSAEKRREEFAKLDDGSDPGPIPECLRRGAP